MQTPGGARSARRSPWNTVQNPPVQNPPIGHPDFLDRSALDRELTRVFEKCHDCRRCLPLCPSFPSLFQAIDRHEQEASELTAAERREVIDLCFQCKLCYNHCPYHPPHEWEIDFPKLMSRAKLVQAREEGIPLSERAGQNQDLIGPIACRTASLANPLMRFGPMRVVMEKATGIDRRWPMPSYESRPLSRQLAQAKPRANLAPDAPRAVLFGTCFVEYSDAQAGRAAFEVLAHQGVAIEYAYPSCCGAPSLHGGDLDGAREAARKVTAALDEFAKADVPIVVPGPTCSYQLKKEYPELLGTEAAERVAQKTVDVGEYLWMLRAEGRLNTDFTRPLGKVAYHLPCHLKAQNIGFRSRQLLRGAGAEVEMLDLCSGVDGTWGMKAQWYEQSLEIAKKLTDRIANSGADHVATDCPLSALRIEERTGRRAVHPIVLLHHAYGLGELT